jgi:putative hydrolase of HD superfamily
MVKKINIQNFINKERMLDRVIRFSANKKIKDQSVSEHSFHTAIYSLVLADFEEKFFGNKIDKERVVKIALLHDMEECLTGDIIHPFKYINKNLKSEIDKMGQEYLVNLFDNLGNKISKEYLEYWNGKGIDKGIEGKIVEAADKLEGLFYAIDEYSLGNREFKKMINDYLKILKRVDLKSVNLFIKGIKIN